MDKITVLDFGGQYSHLIARRLRELGVYSEVLPPPFETEKLGRSDDVKGIVLSGGASSVYDEDSPKCGKEVLDQTVPVLGICYGHQLIAYLLGGKVELAGSGEYGKTDFELRTSAKLFGGWDKWETVWMNHKDRVESMPDGFEVVGSTKNSPVAAYQNEQKGVYGVQFHPEVTHTPKGIDLLKNFALQICHTQAQWDISGLSSKLVNEAREYIGDRRAIIGLSGGVDSSTAATLVSKAIGENLVAVYIDTGLMRHNDKAFLQRHFADLPLKLKVVDKREKFFSALKGVTDPEKKRKIIGSSFIEAFSAVANRLEAEVLVQGTIYSDRIESGHTTNSSTIKSHHNVGGLPQQVDLDIYEPLRNLYKDEVRIMAGKLGLSREIITRHVFPGPGLAIRIIGEVTKERVEIVREAGGIITEELKKENLYDDVWMAFPVLLPVKTVGVQGDKRSYKFPVVLRIIESDDAMTANFARLPYSILERISTRLTNQIASVNRVVYDITNKPPGTMEWE